MYSPFLCFISAALLSSLQVSAGSSSYRAAVVEYNPIEGTSETDRVEANVKRYETFISEAGHKGAEIIVFPENGLTTVKTRSYIPDPADKVVPCDSENPKLNQVVKRLSCAAKNNAIYTVINLLEKRECAPDDKDCPPRGFYIFNTNAVFDRTGMVIARYSKYNLFDEYNTTTTKDPEMVFFDTDFGVRFGTFICFDILFSTPAQRLIQQYRIRDFVFPTFWFSELPFLTALQAQRGWAESNNVNLLASGVNKPGSGSSGSGIYNGEFGAITQIMPETSMSKLLIADVPKLAETCSRSCQERPVRSSFVAIPPEPIVEAAAAAEETFSLLKEKLNRYKSEIINEENTFEKTICSGDFCCDFEVTMKALKPESKNFTCRAVAFNGVRGFGKTFRGGVQSCGVLMCNGPEITNCTNRMDEIPGVFKFEKINIKGTFSPRNSFQMPSTLTDGEELLPLSANKYVFNKVNTEKGLKVSLELVWPVTNLRTFAIWGRDFTRDREPEVPESGASALVSVPVLLLTSFLGFLFFVR